MLFFRLNKGKINIIYMYMNLQISLDLKVTQAAAAIVI